MELGTYKGVFNQNNLCGFETGKSYIFEVDRKPNSPYEIFETSGLYLMLSSEISINRYFKNLKKVD